MERILVEDIDIFNRKSIITPKLLVENIQPPYRDRYTSQYASTFKQPKIKIRFPIGGLGKQKFVKRKVRLGTNLWCKTCKDEQRVVFIGGPVKYGGHTSHSIYFRCGHIESFERWRK